MGRPRRMGGQSKYYAAVARALKTARFILASEKTAESLEPDEAHLQMLAAGLVGKRRK